MTPSELRGRVTLDTCAAAALLAAPTAWIGGATVGLGLPGRGVLAVLNLPWRGAGDAGPLGGRRPPRGTDGVDRWRNRGARPAGRWRPRDPQLPMAGGARH